MFVCICHAVAEHEVAAEVADGAHSVDELSRRTQAGTGCGTCVERLEELLEQGAAGCPLAGLVA